LKLADTIKNDTGTLSFDIESVVHQPLDGRLLKDVVFRVVHWVGARFAIGISFVFDDENFLGVSQPYRCLNALQLALLTAAQRHYKNGLCRRFRLVLTGRDLARSTQPEPLRLRQLRQLLGEDTTNADENLRFLEKTRHIAQLDALPLGPPADVAYYFLKLV
jgi:hypothetical protein